MTPIDTAQFKDLQSQGYIVVDTRQSDVFSEGFIAESISIPLGETFIDTLLELTDNDQKILFVADDKDTPALQKAIKDAGVQNAKGFLIGGYQAWAGTGNKIDMIIPIDADEFAIDYNFDEFYLVDVRSKEDFAKEHAEDAENIVLNDLEQILVEFETSDSYYVYGNTAAEAITAGSVFKKIGFNRIRVVSADFEAIKKTGIPIYTEKKKEKSDSKFSEN